MASKRDKIRLVSSAETGHFYTTDKNKKTTTDKIEMKKYDPVVRKHVIYPEAKIKCVQDELIPDSTRTYVDRGSSSLRIPPQGGFSFAQNKKPADRRAFLPGKLRIRL